MPGPLTAMPPQPGQTPCPIHAYGLWRPGWRDRPVPGRNWIQQQRGRRRFRPESSTGGLTMQLQSRWAAHPVLGPARSRQRGSASPHHPARTLQPITSADAAPRRSPDQDLRLLRPAVPVAQEMGTGLAGGALLLRALPQPPPIARQASGRGLRPSGSAFWFSPQGGQSRPASLVWHRRRNAAHATG